MATGITRRTAITAGLGAPLALLANHHAGAAPESAAMCLHATGFFDIPAEGALIGLLLPAVHRARMPFRLLLVGSDAKVLLEIPIPSDQGERVGSFFDVFISDPDDSDDPNLRVLIVQERHRHRRWTIPTPDGLLLGLLLPAVQWNGEEVGPLAASAVLMGGDDGFNQLLPFIEQNTGQGEHPGGANHHFIGPFIVSPRDPASIGLLLPAVQKVREAAARMAFFDSQGKLLGLVPLPAPAGSESFFDVFFDIQFKNDVEVSQRTADGSVLVAQGAVNAILIGLLLPAVQKVRSSVGLIGASLRSRGQNVGFQEVS